VGKLHRISPGNEFTQRDYMIRKIAKSYTDSWLLEQGNEAMDVTNFCGA
jgi:hypothetical protein